MSARKTTILCLIATICLSPLIALSAINSNMDFVIRHPSSLAQDAIARQLGWIESDENSCGGYYIDEAFIYPINLEVPKNNSIEITSNQTLFSQQGTSILEGKVTATRDGQQITANKAYLYRNPTTGKLSAMDVIGNVHLREPNTLVVAKQGRYNFETKTKSLIDIIYRTSIKGRQIVGPNVSEKAMQKERKITGATAWGKADEFFQTEPKVYELKVASYSTCPPIHPMWKVKASHIVLNKNTGRGYATNARILIKDIPVFYIPYINFPIDSRRKTGFLMPTAGSNNQWGPYLLTPFYWDMAPNFDMMITPGILSKRGIQLIDNFRYLSHINTGYITIGVLPSDRKFAIFQKKYRENPPYIITGLSPETTQAEISRLVTANDTRKSFLWRDDTLFNKNWSSHIDFNYAGDDYYLRNFGSTLNELTANQLLQEGDLFYKGENWNFTGRLQSYQTLHPINSPFVANQYRRLPQLILNGDYPDQPFGLDYFIYNETTRFEILKNPGSDVIFPVGTRLHTQPGFSVPFYWPYFYLTPRVQVALTNYGLEQTASTNTPKNINRAVPIIDVAAGASLYRDIHFYHYNFQQTLEPELYYTYIPYVSQSQIPLFDTTQILLNYDQLFNYNRFTGIDRIGDANQLAAGVTSRFLDSDTGVEKIRLGLGDIIYFQNRRVTLCDTNLVPTCTDSPGDEANTQRFSPLTGLIDFHVSDNWQFVTNAIWDPNGQQLTSATMFLHYAPSAQHILHFGYTYAHANNPASGLATDDAANNLKVTDFSFAWPIFFLRDVSAVGRWSQNWNQAHLQNLLYGLQYDTCCWAVRAVGGRAYLGIDPTQNNTAKYNNEYYIQFSLKGLGNVGTGDPSRLLSTVPGYATQFGEEIR